VPHDLICRWKASPPSDTWAELHPISSHETAEEGQALDELRYKTRPSTAEGTWDEPVLATRENAAAI
jgi:hypothetical protein